MIDSYKKYKIKYIIFNKLLKKSKKEYVKVVCYKMYLLNR